MKKESELITLLNWALNTLVDRLQFGLPEDIAYKRRESRVKGVLREAIVKVEQMEVDLLTYKSENKILKKALENVQKTSKLGSVERFITDSTLSKLNSLQNHEELHEILDKLNPKFDG